MTVNSGSFKPGNQAAFKHGGLQAPSRLGVRGRSTPEYRAWAKMRERCSSPKAKQYKDYGGRGIRVCSSWESFAPFLAYVGLRPTPQHTLGRIDNDGNYEPGNVRWETRTEQARNKRNNTFITYAGKTRALAEWAEIRGIKQGTLSARLRKGWSVEKALA